jgi:hypothetical protein
MAPVAQRRRLDDDEDPDLYDPKYPGLRVVKDGKGVRVPIYMTDGMPPEWMRSLCPAPSDTLRHRPHQLVSDSAELRDAEREAARAYDERNDFLRDAWRSPSNPPPPALRDGQSSRDAYIERLQSAYRTPTGGNGPADEVEALQRRWASPGTTPGPGRRPTQDAAPRSDADQAYEEYCARLQAAWKTR